MIRIFTLLVAATLLLGQLDMASNAAQGKSFALVDVYVQSVKNVHGCCDDNSATLGATDCASECVHAILSGVALVMPPKLERASETFILPMRAIQEWPNGPPPIFHHI